MELKLIAFLFADFAMVLSGAVYGWKFLKKDNVLLGLEWWVVAISGTNFFFYALTESQVLYGGAYFLDAFSRAFGLPVIGIAGLMAVTHAYRPSKLTDILWFAGGFAIAAVLMLVAPEYRAVLGQYGDAALVHAITAAKPWLYLLMWTAFSCFLAYFAWRLFRAGERLQGWSIILALVAGQAIAIIYDFFKIPGDDADHTLFYIAALSTWGFLMFALYHAYCALERAGSRS